MFQFKIIKKQKWLPLFLILFIFLYAFSACKNVQEDNLSGNGVTGETPNSNLSYDILPNNGTIRNITLSPGTDETKLNFIWQSTTEGDGTLTLWEEEREPVTFPAFGSKATAEGLQTGKTYHYTITQGNDQAGPYTFKTFNLTESFSFLLAGDPQIGAGKLASDKASWQNTLQKSLEKWNDISFLISTGDQVNDATNKAQYDAYLSPLALTGLPIANSVGNHDDHAMYLRYFNPPNRENDLGATKAGGDYWYTYGSALFIHINSNQKEVKQHEIFMKKALDNNPDAIWKIVVFHHSLYSSASHSMNEDILSRRAAYVPVLEQLGINVVLMGHDHIYNRTIQIKDNQPDLNGLLYITAATSTGSKYYKSKNKDFFYLAKEYIPETPCISKIDITRNSFTIHVYRIDTMTVVDSYTLSAVS